MSRLQNAKSLAYRDARAWRRVALDFARINALAASRVQNLVAASLRDGHAGTDIGRQIERELEEATKTVAQRRNWILSQDRKDAESASPFSENAWGDLFDLDRSGSFFGSRGGRRASDQGKFAQWRPNYASRHDDLSSAWTLSSAAEDAASPTAQTKRSAKLKWQRAAGLSATPDSSTTSASLDAKAETAQTRSDSQSEAREEWIGDVESAIRERDLKTSTSTTRSGADQAAVDAFSRYDSEMVEAVTGFAARDAVAEEDNYLLPVSDMHIATGGRLQDELEHEAQPRKKIELKTKLSPVQVNTLVSSTSKYSYPISDRFRDMEGLLLAAYDDNFAGLSNSPTPSTATDADKDVNKVVAKPNSAFFDKLRANRTKKEPKSNTVDETEFMAQLFFRGTAKESSPETSPQPTHAPSVSPSAKEEALGQQLEKKEAELVGYKYKIDELSERLDTMRDTCHELTDEAQRREKMHRIQIEQLDHKVGLFTVWAEEVQRRLGLETPPFFASLRKPLKRD